MPGSLTQDELDDAIAPVGGCVRCGMPVFFSKMMPCRRNGPGRSFFCSVNCHDAQRDQMTIRRQLRARAGMFAPRQYGFRERYSQFMPHPSPCQCVDCGNALARIRHRVEQGCSPDWTPSPRPCDGCGWSWTPSAHMHRRARFCSSQCNAASRGQAPFPNSSRVHFVRCRDCDVFLRTSRRHAPIAKCRSCTAQRRAAANRRKNAKRRGAKVGVMFTLVEIGDRDGWRCHLCGKPVDSDRSGMDPAGPTIDHLIPVSQGGADIPENVRLAHRVCNVRRGAGGSVQLLLLSV